MRRIRIYNLDQLLPNYPLKAHAMIICVCKRISDREIARHVHAGMGFDDIQFELGVATQCGRCEECARDVVAQCNRAHPVAALSREPQPIVMHGRLSASQCA
jgi:bacterioferritin-associated ferredoxin